MRKVLRILVAVLLLAVVAIGVLIAYVKTQLPNVGPPPDITVELTPQRLERGKYLATSVSVCLDCHSQRDWSLFSGPPVPGTNGQGGEEFGPDLGFPGTYVASNITPANLKDWSDGEIYRAITSGVGKEGRPLFNIMPHHNFGLMDTEDIYSIIAYVRSLQPIENTTKASKSDFPMSIIVHTLPKKPDHQPRPDAADVVAYGKYLFTAASCGDCHTKQEKGKVVGEFLAGGFDFKFPDGSITRSANITPDVSTGIGDWSVDQFVARFKAYTDSTYVPLAIQPGVFQSPMPWVMYGTMTESDLRAIHAYLRTVPAVKNEIERYTPPSL